MRILIHSNGPHVPSGYGVQCNILVRQLQAMGHDVAVSCMYGLAGQPIRWDGITLYPQGKADFSPDTLFGHAEAHEAELVIIFMDFYKLAPIAGAISQQSWQCAAWMPVDTHDKIASHDRAVLMNSSAVPVGMSSHGTRLLRDAGFDATCIPHSVDLGVFRPPADRDALRREAGVDGKFVIGINAANNDAFRKGWIEQFQAFSAFRQRHDEAVLMLHTDMFTQRGVDLYQLAGDFGITDALILTGQYVKTAGLMNGARMADWYGALDVLSLCSYAEGFGIPLIEAQACGVPVVTADGSAMTELCGPGWLADTTPFYNMQRHADWMRPDPESILDCYQAAYLLPSASRDALSQQARDFAAGYGTEVTAPLWAAFLKGLGGDEG